MQPVTSLQAIDISRGWHWIGLDGLALWNGHGLAI